MDGLFIGKNSGTIATDNLTVPVLLAKSEGLEIMRQTILADAIMWLTPADMPETLEFFCLISGAIIIKLDGEEITLGVGDSFHIHGLKQEVFLHATENTELLYVTNSPMFDTVHDFQNELEELLKDINNKDQITYEHSKQVMKYAIKLFNKLPAEKNAISADEMITAALFHDVGKCFIPDEVLKKKGKLEPHEWRHIIKHPHNSARLLRPHFGEKVAEIAQNHHERLDGSGYPFGLTTREISFEAKIVAVADVFDAMTTDRGYNKPLTHQEAVQELCSLTKLFDIKITTALAEMVNEGTLLDK